jgi:thioredoxin reductase
MLTTGLRPGALGRDSVDVAIVGSGPGGLSAALTCIQKGLSYVVLEKEQEIASTIARYPKGKLVMAEPYDTLNLSLLPVFDSSKEQLIPIWRELIERVGLEVRKGESVEIVQRTPDGAFEVRTTVAAYRAQRVVLSIGTRGKPRTLQVPGENLPKVYSLLEDPDDWRGRSVLVVGGGDSACEAALALADAGAKVMISYRGKGFNRAAPKNKQAIESYAAEGRIKAKLGSQVLAFDPEAVTLALGDGTQKRYPNEGAFVLIGADPPVSWLEKLGIRFVERPHQHQMGKTDDIVRRFVLRAAECPEDAARAAAQVLGGSVGKEPVSRARASNSLPMGEPVSGPRKWLRSATSIFSTRGASQVGQLPPPRNDARGQKKKFDAPVPLSEFAKRQRTNTGHTGHGRRDQLTAGERTRILRMLRDEGGRLADEDDSLYIGTVPAARKYDFDFDDDGPAPPPPSTARHDIPAKPAVVVGIAQANNARRQKRQSAAPSNLPLPHASSRPSGREKPASRPPPVPSRNHPPSAPPSRSKAPSAPPPVPRTKPPSGRRAALPRPFDDAETRTVDDALLEAVRNNGAPPPKRTPFDEPTRIATADPRLLDAGADAAKFLPATTEPTAPRFDEDEATNLASMEGLANIERANRGAVPKEERTRSVDIRNDRSMSDIDWDID